MSSEREAFFQVCGDAEPMKGHYVSLYRVEQFYGGPEEGGWWGRDYVLVASQRYETEFAARYAMNAVDELAEKLSADAKRAFNRGCAAEAAWLEARGLDDSFLPEVSGGDRYVVYLEEEVGEMASTGERTYS